MLAKGNKRKSLATSNGPPSKSPKVKPNGTPAKLPIKQLKTLQNKVAIKETSKKQGNMQKKLPLVVPQDSESDEDDSDLDDLEIDESSDDLEIDMDGIKHDDEDEEDSEDDDDEEDDDDNDIEGSDNSAVECDEDNEELLGGEDQEVDDDEDEDEDVSQEQETEEEEESEPEQKSKKNVKNSANQNKKTEKQRYVIFVGNIPYSCTADDIRNHFKQVGPIVDVRIVTFKNNKPKGYCFVEFTNSSSYEKALSLHHTYINTRRINVEYTGKSKNENQKKDIKKKNFKLRAMQKEGKLEGNVKPNQKRTIRRAKARQENKV
ncbi:hypothetical protein RN001_002069 [Aquatica leii]|uniref:RRM domain-containing protein n=1 Tax=Aquatica leii TaxID=1421715 RepID=A0AAN7QN95_9COLE|nr:hypothetical protein RN001_002069 [Aquatica leii]